jgi:hypothetical protein
MAVSERGIETFVASLQGVQEAKDGVKLGVKIRSRSKRATCSDLRANEYAAQGASCSGTDRPFRRSIAHKRRCRIIVWHGCFDA